MPQPRQVIQLVGVIDDGTLFVDTVRRAFVTSLDTPLGMDLRISLRLVYPSGVIVALASDPTSYSRMTIASCDQSLGNKPVLSKIGVVQADGSVLFTITPLDQKRLSPGRWTYDVQTAFGGIRWQSIPISSWTFHASNAQLC